MAARILISLSLGALTTWLIAILCAFENAPTSLSGTAGPTIPTWTFRQWRTPGHISTNYSPCFNDREVLAYQGAKPDLVPAWSHMNRPPAQNDYTPEERSYLYWNETGLGWPLCTFIHTTDYDGRSRTPNYIIARSGAKEWNFRSRVVFIPYSPHWSGFISTELILSLPWFSILCVSPAARRRRRARRGLCLHCGYDLKGSGAVCPECGR